MLSQFANHRIEKVAPLIADNLDQAVKLTSDVLVKKFCRDCYRILP